MLRWQKLYLFFKDSIVFKHCFIKIANVGPCLIFSRSLLLIKSSRFIRSLLHSSLARCIFSSGKSCLLLSSSPWSVNLLKTKLVPLKGNVFTTAPPIVNNNDAIYFLPKVLSNQPPNKEYNGYFFIIVLFGKHFGLSRRATGITALGTVGDNFLWSMLMSLF